MTFEPIVVASRGYPEMVDAVKATGRHLPERLVDPMTAQPSPFEKTSAARHAHPWERKVLGLLARGYTNEPGNCTLPNR
jgi:hypothetical protein